MLIELILKFLLNPRKNIKSVGFFFYISIIIFGFFPIFKVFDLNGNSFRIYNSISKMLQVLMAYRIIKKFRSLEKVYNTIFYILPSLYNILCLMGLILYLYTILGINLFAYLKNGITVNGVDIHFRNFGTTLFTLIRIATSEAWFMIVADCARKSQPNWICVDISNYEDFIKYG